MRFELLNLCSDMISWLTWHLFVSPDSKSISIKPTPSDQNGWLESNTLRYLVANEYEPFVQICHSWAFNLVGYLET